MTYSNSRNIKPKKVVIAEEKGKEYVFSEQTQHSLNDIVDAFIRFAPEKKQALLYMKHPERLKRQYE